MSQLDQYLKPLISNYEVMSPEEQIRKKVKFIGEKQLQDLIERSCEVDYLVNEYRNGNIKFDNDLPYPESFWQTLAGFEPFGLSLHPIDCDFRRLLRYRRVSVYTYEESVAILKEVAKYIAIEKLVRKE